MNRALSVLWLLVAFAFGCLTMSIVLIHPAFAADTKPADCVSPEQYQQIAEAHDGKIVGAARFNGDHTDSLLIIQGGSVIAIVGFKNGCLVTDIIPLDTVTPLKPKSPVQPGKTKDGVGA